MAKSSRTDVLRLTRGRIAPAGGYPARAFRGLMSVAAVFCAAAILSGCLLDPQVPSPALDVPDNFQRANGTNGHLPDDFSMFRSKSLTRLIGEARSANLDIAAAMARIEQADAQVRIASQPLIPLLDIGGSGSQNFSHKAGVPVKTNTVTAQFTASYELDFWGKNRATRYSAEAAAFQTRFDGAIIAIATDASVASTYFQAIAAKKRLTVSKANLGTAVKELEAIKARKEAGTAFGLDVAQQETLVANQNVKIPPLELAYEQNLHALAILLGRPPEGFGARIEDLYAVHIPVVRAGLPSELLTRRPDIASAEAALAAARFNVQSARAAMLPSIKLTGDGGFTSTALRNLFSPQNTFYDMAAGLTMPLLNQFQLQAQVDLDRARYMELLENYRKAIISAFRDVEDQLTACKKLAEQERLQQDAVRSARKAYQISSERLRSGIIDITTLITVQQTLFSAEDALAQVRLSRLQAVVALYQALGGGWERPFDTEVAQLPRSDDTNAAASEAKAP